jgi:hypothetical protein
MSVQQSEHSITQKQTILFTLITVIGVVAILLGLALIIFVQYHERAYIFLGLGAGGVIGGIAGIIVVGQRTRAALGYGVIALGMVGILVGLNYLLGRYGPGPNQAHGHLVISLSIFTLLAGIVGALMVQPKAGIATVSSIFMLGVIGSIGIISLIAGTVYLAVLDYPKYAYLLLGIGVVCLFGGIVCAIYAQHRVKAKSNSLSA